ncbi:nucleotidyl transferase AbiEii/AbiGii toxin family protein [Nocardioides zeae]|uniref:Nucleotidyl transferase AbiEii/AbiGii toxin family protein n=2 Tax=Nocardioides zeae TaxID=1457234 RepID=A0A6P0HPR0_9ACTN|nr:nucleotidyl transferase AbiEii/AbiGii toxin family protein [Nocardioides zeae]NEN80300.1 nucleotidyl transferase AbiEii/AbiGii toxin family protein [Nocardioides zeae]
MAFEQAQQRVAAVALRSAAASGFALAGAGAIRAHGVTDRPTQDVDLFTTQTDPAAFSAAVDEVIAGLASEGFQVAALRRLDGFARLQVLAPPTPDDATGGPRPDSQGGLVVEVDLGIDWRAHPPVTLDVGPVLALEDAVANKVSALYSRGEVRDYLDVDAIRQTGRFSDDELLAAAAERDPGFEPVMFARQLRGVERAEPAAVEPYGLDANDLAAIRLRLRTWAARIDPAGASAADLRAAAHHELQRARATAGRLDDATPPRVDDDRPPSLDTGTQRSAPGRSVKRRPLT